MREARTASGKIARPCRNRRASRLAPRARTAPVASPGLPVPALAAGGHAADLFVRRDPVLRLPAIDLVRPRPVVRERVPVLLRSRDREVGRVPRDVPRADDGHGAADQFRDGRLRDPVVAVLPRRRRRRARDRGAGGRVLEAVRRGGRLRLGRLRIPRAGACASCARSAWGSTASCAALAVWLGTPLLFYMYVAPPFSHACSAFGVALFTYVWLRIRDDWSTRGLIALGAAGALMAMVREQDAFFAAGPALDFLWLLAAVGGRRLSPKPRRRREARGRGCRRGGHRVRAWSSLLRPRPTSILNGHLGPHCVRRAQDELDGAARAAGAVLARARVLRLDAAGADRARGALRCSSSA